MNNIKYTNDNKKVIVIGKLNSTEYIVQEIFVDHQGNELPSGENFITKTLHDQQLKSWHSIQKELFEKEEKIYAKKIEILQNDLITLEKEYNKNILLLKDKLSYISKILKHSHTEIFEKLNEFLSDEFEYVVISAYNTKILTKNEFWLEINEEEYHNTYRFGIPLISLFGHDDGSFSFNVNKYKDGSSSSYKTVAFTKTLHEAKELLSKELLFENYQLNDDMYEEFKKWNICVPDIILNNYKQRNIDIINKNIKKSLKDIEIMSNIIQKYKLLN